MRKLFVLLLLAGLTLSGCAKKTKTAAEPTGPLVPNGREREVLAAYGLNADTPQGQDKLEKLRAQNKKLKESRDRLRTWGAAK